MSIIKQLLILISITFTFIGQKLAEQVVAMQNAVEESNCDIDCYLLIDPVHANQTPEVRV